MHKIIFITGASGFLGRNASRVFSEKGHTVVGLDVAPFTDASDWGVSGCAQVPVSCDALSSLAKEYGMPDCVVHCAGSGSVAYSLVDPVADFKNNVTSTLEVLEFSRLHGGAVRVVLPSSAAVYGNCSNFLLSEEMPLQPVSPYGVHKRVMEELAVSYGNNFGVPSVIIRFFSIYGLGLRKQLLWDACNRIATNDYTFFGTGEEKRDWLHVADAARLLELVVQYASPQVLIVNGGTGKGESVCRVLSLLGSAWGQGEQPFFSGIARSGDPNHLVADTTQAKRLGFTASISVESGIADYVKWFKKEKYD